MLRCSYLLITQRNRLTASSSSISTAKSWLWYPFKRTMSTTSGTAGPVQVDITNRITTALEPIHLTVENESYKHSVPKGSETHFKVVVVSEKFEGLALIEQHRLVNEVLALNLQSGVHALAIKSMTPKKWHTLQNSTASPGNFTTPACMGGSKHDPSLRK